MSTLANHVIGQVTFESGTGMAEDRVTNTFHFRKPAATDFVTATVAIQVEMARFYNTVPSGGTSVLGSYMSSGLVHGTDRGQVSYYDGSIAPNLRAPTTYAFTLPGASGSARLPNEVALCLSFKDSVLTTGPSARQRGRIYLGPLDASAGINTVGDLAPSLTFIMDLARAGQTLGESIIALGTGYHWAVYSPTDNAMFNIDRVFVDNAFDTQRRRGIKATGRITLSII